MALDIQTNIEKKSDVLIVHISGNINAETIPILEKKIPELMEIANKILVDCTKTIEITDGGVHFFFSWARETHAKEGQMAFYGFSRIALDQIKVLGYERTLKVFKNEKEGLLALQA